MYAPVIKHVESCGSCKNGKQRRNSEESQGSCQNACNCGDLVSRAPACHSQLVICVHISNNPSYAREDFLCFPQFTATPEEIKE